MFTPKRVLVRSGLQTLAWWQTSSKVFPNKSTTRRVHHRINMQINNLGIIFMCWCNQLLRASKVFFSLLLLLVFELSLTGNFANDLKETFKVFTARRKQCNQVFITSCDSCIQLQFYEVNMSQLVVVKKKKKTMFPVPAFSSAKIIHTWLFSLKLRLLKIKITRTKTKDGIQI